MRIAIIGGGAAGFFLGAQLVSPLLDVYIFEKASTPLQKVKISGGGRCNVTHACFDPNVLVDFYPRGQKELKSVFGRFQPGDTMAWFEDRGVPLKIQEDMRVFPVSDNSADIVECLIKENQKNYIHICLNEAVKSVSKTHDTSFEVVTSKNQYNFDKVIFAPGASKQAWQLIKKLGHSIIEPVPSLFTFNCKDARIKDLPGTTFANAEVKVVGSHLENAGSLLITHWGFSGPAILVLSAWGARELANLDYTFKILVNFIGRHPEDALETLIAYKNKHKNLKIGKYPLFDVTKKFWKAILDSVQINPQFNWQEIADKKLHHLATALVASTFSIQGKSTFKDEFVTAGGVDLKEINFKTMESKIVPGVYFSGEVLNIDAVTGGFNFQACWSESFIISESVNALLH